MTAHSEWVERLAKRHARVRSGWRMMTRDDGTRILRIGGFCDWLYFMPWPRPPQSCHARNKMIRDWPDLAGLDDEAAAAAIADAVIAQGPENHRWPA